MTLNKSKVGRVPFFCKKLRALKEYTLQRRKEGLPFFFEQLWKKLRAGGDPFQNRGALMHMPWLYFSSLILSNFWKQWRGGLDNSRSFFRSFSNCFATEAKLASKKLKNALRIPLIFLQSPCAPAVKLRSFAYEPVPVSLSPAPDNIGGYHKIQIFIKELLEECLQNFFGDEIGGSGPPRHPNMKNYQNQGTPKETLR